MEPRFLIVHVQGEPITVNANYILLMKPSSEGHCVLQMRGSATSHPLDESYTQVQAALQRLGLVFGDIEGALRPPLPRPTPTPSGGEKISKPY